MLPYKTLINFDRGNAMPLYLQICNAFIMLVKKGTLKSSDALPSTRKLAELINVNRSTANLAYDELISQGWAESMGRKGIFISGSLPSVSLPLAEDAYKNRAFGSGFRWTNKFEEILPVQNLQNHSLTIDDGSPDVRLAPIDHLMAEYRSISRRFYGKNFLKYGSPKGCENLRNSISKYLSDSRGITAGAEEIMITKGSQMGLYLTARLLIESGDLIAVGESNYHAADATFKLCEAVLLRIPVDQHGMDTEYLEHILLTKTIKAVYVIPQYHFPTTVTMSLERRLKLLALSREHRFAVIEDDCDSEFHYQDLTYLPLAGMDDNLNVIYIGSFSKTFAPSLRMGFLAAPLKFVQAAATLRNYIDKQGNTLMEEAFASLFENGEIDRHFRKTIKIYKERRNIFCNTLTSDFSNFMEFNPPGGGLAVWSHFDKGIDLVKASSYATSHGLHIGNGNFHKNEIFSHNAMRLGFASLEANEMYKAFEILNTALKR